MDHRSSEDDRIFLDTFESATLDPEAFTHEAHLRVAYTCLCNSNPEQAFERFRSSLHQLLSENDIDPSKYHATLTRAWLLAVWHFMSETSSSNSFGEFIANNGIMLDPEIMMTHYSEQALGSDRARQEFFEPDLEPIPRHEAPGT
jgi:hypothetical protein